MLPKTMKELWNKFEAVFVWAILRVCMLAMTAILLVLLIFIYKILIYAITHA